MDLDFTQLYGHCSSAKEKRATWLLLVDQIGTTGTSGLALGDHLHFGILVQGEEVRPQQWMDKKVDKRQCDKCLGCRKGDDR